MDSNTQWDGMEHDYLLRLKSTHPSLRLLGADNLPLIASFLCTVFLKPNRRSIPYPELVSRLDDYLYGIRRVHGEEFYSKSGRDYLEDWSRSETPFLRKYYVQQSDEPECDLTPDTEKALEWLRSLVQEKRFVGTESRLLTLFDLLKELARQTESNSQARVEALEKEKASLEEKIEKAREGIFERLDSTQVKERFFELEETAQKLLADFRQIESNFRGLDRETRERIASNEKAKGLLLDEIFLDHDVIWDSDQGKSFKAFWEFLMSPPRQEEFDKLLQAVYGRKEIRALSPDLFLSKIQHYLLEAGEKVYRTNNMLADQLRKFLDDQAYLENRRIMELIKGFEKTAIEVKNNPPKDRDFMEVDDVVPDFDLVMSRGLFAPVVSPVISAETFSEDEPDVPLDVLYNQIYVDEHQLLSNIRKMLESSEQVSLNQIVSRFPLEKGLAEAVTYLNIASRDSKAMVDEEQTELITYRMPTGEARRLKIPLLIFTRHDLITKGSS